MMGDGNIELSRRTSESKRRALLVNLYGAKKLFDGEGLVADIRRPFTLLI